MTRSRRIGAVLAGLTAAALIAWGGGAPAQASAGVTDSSDIHPSSTSWTSPSAGWVLGWSPCGSELCPELLRTTDGGATWSEATTPDIRPSDVDSQTRVFFAERHGHSIGLVTNGRELFVTYDGAGTWRPLRLPHAGLIGGVGADAQSVFVVVHEQVGSQVSTQAFSSSILHPRWRAVSGVATTSRGSIFSTKSVVTGSGRAVQISTSTYGGVVKLWTALNGHRFQPAYPCNPQSVMHPGMGAGGRQFVLCSSDPGRGRMYKVLRTGSADDGFTTRAGTPPVDGITSDFAVSEESTIAVGATKDGVALVHESFDSGRTWQTTLVAPDTGPVRDLAFQDAQHGVLVAGYGAIASSALYRTSDGGRTWHRLDL